MVRLKMELPVVAVLAAVGMAAIMRRARTELTTKAVVEAVVAVVSLAVMVAQGLLLFVTPTHLPQLQPQQVLQQSRCLVVTEFINGQAQAQ